MGRDYETNTPEDAGRYEEAYSDFDPHEDYEPEPDTGPPATRPQAAGPLMDALAESIRVSRTLPNNPNRPIGAPLSTEQFPNRP